MDNVTNRAPTKTLHTATDLHFSWKSRESHSESSLMISSRRWTFHNRLWPLLQKHCRQETVWADFEISKWHTVFTNLPGNGIRFVVGIRFDLSNVLGVYSERVPVSRGVVVSQCVNGKQHLIVIRRRPATIRIGRIRSNSKQRPSNTVDLSEAKGVTVAGKAMTVTETEWHRKWWDI